MSQLRFAIALATVLAGTSAIHAQPVPDAPPAPVEPPTPADVPPRIEATPISERDACIERRRELAQRAQESQDPVLRTRILTTLPDCGVVGSPVPAAQPVPASAPAADPEDVVSGFALELRLETTATLIASDATLATTQAGVFLGHRGPTLTIGVGFEIGRVSSGTDTPSDPASPNTDRATTSVLVMPGLRAVVARRGATELLGQVDLGYGSTWRSSGSGASDPSSVTRYRFQTGPTLRHWITPSFAIGATTGLRYDLQTMGTPAGPGATVNQYVSITSLFTSLQMTGVF